ncbi:hypothetical protein DPEC_G00201590 [Dallia pectoralis]|uniref:Uncharacterized protein n=1 Tax=Dallia pectoralis TaxID=75939 RepID=A0ACC2G912_DALPE|nr:hypothetical protein DPEC_G00201590 [Dallia pectoralis]
MREIIYKRVLFYVSGLHMLSALPVVHFVQYGQNISLLCNLTPDTQEITWFQMRSEEPVTLLTARLSKIHGTEGVVHNEEHWGHFYADGDLRIMPINLTIVQVTESDLGLYYCAGRYGGTVRFGKGIRLSSSETAVTKRDLGLCWTLLACAVPVSALFSILCAFGVCLRLGKPIFFCTTCVKRNSSLKEDNLHYASLKHIKGRLTPQRLPGLAQKAAT